MNVVRFLKDWTLPVAIAVGTASYLLFWWVPALDGMGTWLAPVFDTLFPLLVFLTLFVTFCKVDFHQMLPHRWHAGVLVAQLLLVGVCVGMVFLSGNDAAQRLLWEAVLTCVIGPSASAAPLVVGKLGGNISTMTTYTLLSALVSALLIPVVFPLLEPGAGTQAVAATAADAALWGGFFAAFVRILQKVSLVLLLPLVLGWLVQHHLPSVGRRVSGLPNLGFYLWACSLAITTGITVKNIVHSAAPLRLLLLIAGASLVLCFVQFLIGRAVGRRLGEEVNAGQALFQKNTALSIWVAYMYLNPVSSIGAGCYVLWQNIINSLELWAYRRQVAAGPSHLTDQTKP